MSTFRRRRTATVLGLLAVVSLSGMAFGAPGSGGAVDLSQLVKRSVLVFPFDVSNTVTVPDASSVSMLLTDVARSRLITTGNYTVVSFYPGLPTVARLHNDQQLTDSDVKEPFAADNVKAVKVAKLAGYDLAFIGSLDDYSFDSATNQATATVSGRLLDAANGKIVKSATLSATSSQGGTAKEPQKAEDAARSAGEQLMTKLEPMISVAAQPTTPTKTTKAPPPTNGGKKRRNDNWLWGLLAIGLGLGIGLASGGGGGGGGGGTSDLPPAPPR